MLQQNLARYNFMFDDAVRFQLLPECARTGAGLSFLVIMRVFRKISFAGGFWNSVHTYRHLNLAGLMPSGQAMLTTAGSSKRTMVVQCT